MIGLDSWGGRGVLDVLLFSLRYLEDGDVI